MNQPLRFALILILAGLLAPPSSAYAQEKPEAAVDPEKAVEEASEEEDEEEQAAKHFSNGRALYTAAKYKEAIEELLKAYTLRPAPPILLNIARTYEKLEDKSNALKYYKEFLLKARMVDPNRARVEGVVKSLEKEVSQKTGAVTSAEGTDTPTAQTTAPDQEGVSSSAILQLIHTPVDAAQVNKPVTILAELPPMVEADRVVVNFRKAGELNFREIQLEAQGEAYVTRIPAIHITSTSLQYFIEAYKGTGRNSLVATAGTKVNPHIIVIEGGRAPTVGPVVEVEIISPYRKWFWYSAISSAAFLGAGITFAVLASDRASAMEKWVNEQSCGTLCQEGKGEPAKPFDIKARDWESQGKTFSALGGVLIGLGIATAGATGYLWYKDRQYVKAERTRLQGAQEGIRFVGLPWGNHRGFGLMGQVTF